MTLRHCLLAATLLALSAGVAAAPPTSPPTAATRICIANRDIKAKNLSAEHGYYVRTSSGWWRNTVSCPVFAPDRALVTRSFNDQQCRGDQVEVFHPFSRINYGGCALGAWEKAAGPPLAPKP